MFSPSRDEARRFLVEAWSKHRAQFERLRASRGDEHAALHAALECLGEVIWSAQRHGTPPDAALYLACLDRQP